MRVLVIAAAVIGLKTKPGYVCISKYKLTCTYVVPSYADTPDVLPNILRLRLFWDAGVAVGSGDKKLRVLRSYRQS